MGVFELTTAGLDVGKTLRSGQIFRVKEQGNGGVYQVQSRDKVCTIMQHTLPEKFTIETKDEDLNYWENLLCVNEPDPDIEEFMSKTAERRRIYEYGKGLRIFKQDPWEMLVSFIISQRNNIPRIKSCIEAVCETAGRPLGNGLYAFPTPIELQSIRLDKCGLGYRREYLEFAAAFIDGGCLMLDDLRKGRADLMTALSELQCIRGVGIKVAQCVALFGLGHTEAFPVDIWITRALEDGIITVPDEVKSLGDNAGIVQQYIYYYYINCGRAK